MAEPPVATVYYRPENPPGERVFVSPDPIPVPGGAHVLVWLRENRPSVPWSFVGIDFDRPEIMSQVNVQNRVITAVDDNASPGNQGTIKYTLTIRDDQSGQVIIQDPEIENEFGGPVDPGPK